jgi:Domain of unknown function (DUF4148)
MKHAFLTVLLLATSTFAVAQTTNPAPLAAGDPNTSADVAAPTGKSRAQVMAELVQAQKAGLIPTTEADYPPSDNEIRLNRERYASQQN